MPRMTKVGSWCLFLRMGDYPKDAIPMVINEAYEGKLNCTDNSKVSAYITSANI